MQNKADENKMDERNEMDEIKWSDEIRRMKIRWANEIIKMYGRDGRNKMVGRLDGRTVFYK